MEQWEVLNRVLGGPWDTQRLAGTKGAKGLGFIDNFVLVVERALRGTTFWS